MNLIAGFFDGLKPEPILKVSEWSDQHRYLAPESTAEPGRWRTSRTPYLREVMDKLSSFDPTQTVIVQKGAQLGFTETGMNCVGYFIDNAPSPILYVLPTVDTAKKVSNTRLEKMIKATPRLRKKIPEAKSRDKGNTILAKEFPGGTLTMAGANSAAGLRSMPIRVLVLDEVDEYPLDLDEQGSPIALAKARTRTFAKRKIYMLSTPTTESLSVIEKEYLATSQKKYYVPCPECAAEQTLVFTQLVYPTNKPIEQIMPDDVKYQCSHCGYLIEERFKTQMLEAGSWVEEKPENTSETKSGYFINSLYSPYGWYSWTDAVKEYLAAKDDVLMLKAFTNTVLGETSKDSGEKPDWEVLYNRRDTYEINKPCKEVSFITAGVDVQPDRIEVEIVGWGRGQKSWSLDYRVLVGRTTEIEVWDKLAAIVNETWEREDRVVMPLYMMCVDTGYNTSEVYTFCRRFDESKVYPIKGQDKQTINIMPPKQIDCNIHGNKVGKIRIVHVGVSIIKSETYGRLKLSRREDMSLPDGWCFFPQYNETYFKGLTSEQLEFKMQDGYRKYFWVKKFERNEPLDCRVYARAAAALVGIDRFKEEHFDAIEANYGYGEAEPKREKKKSSFWDK